MQGLGTGSDYACLDYKCILEVASGGLGTGSTAYRHFGGTLPVHIPLPMRDLGTARTRQRHLQGIIQVPRLPTRDCERYSGTYKSGPVCRGSIPRLPITPRICMHVSMKASQLRQMPVPRLSARCCAPPEPVHHNREGPG